MDLSLGGYEVIKTFKPSRARVYTTRQLEEKLDWHVSQIRRAQLPYCVVCSSVERLEAGHYFPRFLRPVRWDFANVWPLCHACNMRHEGNPYRYQEFMLRTLGPRDFDNLATKAHANIKFSYAELLHMLEGFKLELAVLRAA